MINTRSNHTRCNQLHWYRECSIRKTTILMNTLTRTLEKLIHYFSPHMLLNIHPNKLVYKLWQVTGRADIHWFLLIKLAVWTQFKDLRQEPIGHKVVRCSVIHEAAETQYRTWDQSLHWNQYGWLSNFYNSSLHLFYRLKGILLVMLVRVLVIYILGRSTLPH